MTIESAALPRRRRVSARAVVAVMLALALGWIGADAPAQERTNGHSAARTAVRGVSLAELEKAFWICDYAATTRGVDLGTAIMCVAITDDLKRLKFNEDLDALLAWWHDNKPAEHGALEAAERGLAAR